MTVCQAYKKDDADVSTSECALIAVYNALATNNAVSVSELLCSFEAIVASFTDT